MAASMRSTYSSSGSVRPKRAVMLPICGPRRRTSAGSSGALSILRIEPAVELGQDRVHARLEPRHDVVLHVRLRARGIELLACSRRKRAISSTSAGFASPKFRSMAAPCSISLSGVLDQPLLLVAVQPVEAVLRGDVQLDDGHQHVGIEVEIADAMLERARVLEQVALGEVVELRRRPGCRRASSVMARMSRTTSSRGAAATRSSDTSSMMRWRSRATRAARTRSRSAMEVLAEAGEEEVELVAAVAFDGVGVQIELDEAVDDASRPGASGCSKKRRSSEGLMRASAARISCAARVEQPPRGRRAACVASARAGAVEHARRALLIRSKSGLKSISYGSSSPRNWRKTPEANWCDVQVALKRSEMRA